MQQHPRVLTTEMGEELTAASTSQQATGMEREGLRGCETGASNMRFPQDSWMPDLLFSVPTLAAQEQSQGETGKEASEGGDFRLPFRPCLLASISTSTSPREAAMELLDEQSAAML